MFRWVGQLLGLVMAALGIAAAPDATALGIAIAVVAVATLTIALALAAGPLRAADADAPHPLRGIDVGAALDQSDPDAAGHPRPRAPGVAVAA